MTEIYTANQTASSILYDCYSKEMTAMYEDKDKKEQSSANFYVERFQNKVKSLEFCTELERFPKHSMYAFYNKGQNEMIEHYTAQIRKQHAYCLKQT